MRQALSRLAAAAADLIFPRRCPFCGKVSAGGVCAQCAVSLPRVGAGACPRCGREKEYCVCGRHDFAFDRCASPFYYEGAAKKGVLRLKFLGREDSAAAFAACAAETARREYADERFSCVTCVPLSRSERRRRGYNQSERLARRTARELGIKYADTLTKPRDIKPQRTCGADERWSNVSGAFAAKGAVHGTVLLIDDIVTTGATLSECAAALRGAGAQRICCLTAVCVKYSGAGKSAKLRDSGRESKK